jgi:hypothetical protein
MAIIRRILLGMACCVLAALVNCDDDHDGW